MDRAERLFAMFTSLNLPWNPILRQQFAAAKIRFEDCCSSWFFDFAYEVEVPRLNLGSRVPVILEIAEKSESPVFLHTVSLHFLEGHLTEMEVVNYAGAQIREDILFAPDALRRCIIDDPIRI